MTELEYYAAPGPLTQLPPDVGAVDDVRSFVQGLLVHTAWAAAYGIGPELVDERQTRTVTETLDAVRRIDPRPLHEARPPALRAGIVCRHFATLATALLRDAGVPARARCGFGSYFEPDKFVDHWIVEQHDGSRWVRVDYQLDALQCELLGLPFSADDLPPGAFLTGGEAWQRIRAGEADPEAFGIFDMWGAWFVRANIVRDVAALNKVEMLPCDDWGRMADDGDVAWVDELAALTVDGDLRAWRERYDADDSVRMPGEVTSYTDEGSRTVRVAI